MLCAADLDVVATRHLLDLAGGARAIVNEHDLTFAQLSHRRFFLENLATRLARKDGRDQGRSCNKRM